jgi:hypothetical protein
MYNATQGAGPQAGPTEGADNANDGVADVDFEEVGEDKK